MGCGLLRSRRSGRPEDRHARLRSRRVRLRPNLRGESLGVWSSYYPLRRRNRNLHRPRYNLRRSGQVPASLFSKTDQLYRPCFADPMLWNIEVTWHFPAPLALRAISSRSVNRGAYARIGAASADIGHGSVNIGVGRRRYRGRQGCKSVTAIYLVSNK
jgi:hypothetical protein